MLADLAQLLVMFLAFLAYLIFSGWAKHRRGKDKPPRQWWGQGL